VKLKVVAFGVENVFRALFVKSMTERVDVKPSFDPCDYAWMHDITRLGWGWEFLRRNPDYCGAYTRSLGASASAKIALDWGLLRFENPHKNALRANPFWRMKASRHILPLVTGSLRPGAGVEMLDLTKLDCRATVYPLGVEDRQDVLFAADGRFLQLSVFGTVPLDRALLLTPALPSSPYADARLAAVRRLTDLVRHRRLRARFYPRERRAPRLMEVIRALDAASVGLPYRQIASMLYGAARVERDWTHPGNHLRDRTRRAVAQGRALMNGGYRRLLD
jgi:hypothetical protein